MKQTTKTLEQVHSKEDVNSSLYNPDNHHQYSVDVWAKIWKCKDSKINQDW
jgi:hypothetical protein